MKSTPNLASKLNRIREELEGIIHPHSNASLLRDLDTLIAELHQLRASLVNPALISKTIEIQGPLDQVIAFLNFAKNDGTLHVLLSSSGKAASPKPKRLPVEIPDNLTNDQIRTLLQGELTKVELKSIAAQRAISVGKSNAEEIRRNILRNLERQEGYGRLATP